MKRHLLILVVVILILLAIFVGIFRNKVKDYAAQHGFALTLEENDGFSDLYPLLPTAKENLVFMYGESHGIAENERMVLKLFKFLHQKAGYRYLALEVDFAYTYLINKYLRTGDEAYLLKMDKWYYDNTGRTEESYRFFRELYLFNSSLPEEEKIMVWCTDLAHGIKYTMERISEVIGRIEPKDKGFRLGELFRDLEKKGVGGLSYRDIVEFDEKCRQIVGDRSEEELLLLVRSLKDVYGWRKSKDQPGGFLEEQDIRERSMLAYYDYFFRTYRPEETGRVFAYHGSAHIKKQATPEESREILAIFLNEQLEQSKGKVFSFYAFPVSGRARDGKGKVRRVTGVEPDLKLASYFLPSRFTLFFAENLSRLAAESSFLNYKVNGLKIKDVYDAVLIMKNVTPEKGLNLEVNKDGY
ncbi:MAG TPA: erythromycin esterase family protein [Clostridia bacterium]|nr:erythromycin esterase family protein [Clostridia bacterium]